MENSPYRGKKEGCCFQCEERFPAFQDVCATRLKEKAERDEWKQQIEETKKKERVFNNYHFHQVHIQRKIRKSKGDAY